MASESSSIETRHVMISSGSFQSPELQNLAESYAFTRQVFPFIFYFLFLFFIEKKPSRCSLTCSSHHPTKSKVDWASWRLRITAVRSPCRPLSSRREDGRRRGKVQFFFPIQTRLIFSGTIMQGK